MARWQTISAFPSYDVSDDGRVLKARANIRARGIGAELRQAINGNGRATVSLYDETGMRTTALVHRLVAEAFVAPEVGKEWVCHRDGNPLNNHFSNLYWGDAADNAADKVRHGRQPRTATGRRSRLTIEQARMIREEYQGQPGEQRRVAERFGVHRALISLLLAGKIYVEAA